MKHAVLVLLLLAGALPAAAAPCNTPELLATFPPEGARGITTDATLSAAYASSADYLGEEVLLIPDGGEPRPVPATFDRAESLLSIKPPELTPGLGYSVRWPGLRGVDTATPGLGRELHFFAGAGPDQEPPTFFGLGGATWDLSRERSNCTDDIEDRFVFDLDLGVAGDDGGRDALALMVFQTAGRNALGPVPVLVRPIPESVVRVELPASLAAGHVCFSAQVRDLTGKVSAPSLNQSCVETTSPPFFRGCAVGGRGGGGWLALLGLLVIWRWRRR